MAAVMLGLPFPWSENIQLQVLKNPKTDKRCEYFDLTNMETIKQLSLYGLDILRNEEDDSICFGVTPAELKGEDVPIGVVIHHMEYPSFANYLFPLKKMEFMGVEVFVPNNPIAFLEKMNEDGNDALKEINLFEQSNSKMAHWEKVRMVEKVENSVRRRVIPSLWRCALTRLFNLQKIFRGGLKMGSCIIKCESVCFQ